MTLTLLFFEPIARVDTFLCAVGGRSEAPSVRVCGPRCDGGQLRDGIGGHLWRDGGHRGRGDRPPLGRNGSGKEKEAEGGKESRTQQARR